MVPGAWENPRNMSEANEVDGIQMGLESYGNSSGDDIYRDHLAESDNNTLSFSFTQSEIETNFRGRSTGRKPKKSKELFGLKSHSILRAKNKMLAS